MGPQIAANSANSASEVNFEGVAYRSPHGEFGPSNSILRGPKIAVYTANLAVHRAKFASAFKLYFEAGHL